MAAAQPAMQKIAEGSHYAGRAINITKATARIHYPAPWQAVTLFHTAMQWDLLLKKFLSY